jgi:endonuclease YncB( thermonuclease family)
VGQRFRVCVHERADDPALAGRASVTHQLWSRQTVRRVGTLIVVGCLGLLLGSALAATPRKLVATVDRVTDGDSVIGMTDNGTKLCIRLLVIDAPELPYNGKPGQPYAEKARDYLGHLMAGKRCAWTLTVPISTSGCSA